MKKKDFFNDLAIASALGLIFGAALHKWVYGLIIAVIYFLSSMLIIKIKDKNRNR